MSPIAAASPPAAPSAPPAPRATVAGPGDPRQQLLQLVPLFEETKQFLRSVETVDSSAPRIEPDASVDTARAGGRSELMQLIPLFEETKQFLRKVETVDKSGPLLDLSEDDGSSEFTEGSAQQQLMQLIPLFEETKQFLRKVETADRSAPLLAGWGASPSAGTPTPQPEPEPEARSSPSSVRSGPPPLPSSPSRGPPPLPPPPAPVLSAEDSSAPPRIDTQGIKMGALLKEIERRPTVSPIAAASPPGSGGDASANALQADMLQLRQDAVARFGVDLAVRAELTAQVEDLQAAEQELRQQAMSRMGLELASQAEARAAVAQLQAELEESVNERELATGRLQAELSQQAARQDALESELAAARDAHVSAGRYAAEMNDLRAELNQTRSRSHAQEEELQLQVSELAQQLHQQTQHSSELQGLLSAGQNRATASAGEIEGLREHIAQLESQLALVETEETADSSGLQLELSKAHRDREALEDELAALSGQAMVRLGAELAQRTQLEFELDEIAWQFSGAEELVEDAEEENARLADDLTRADESVLAAAKELRQAKRNAAQELQVVQARLSEAELAASAAAEERRLLVGESAANREELDRCRGALQTVRGELDAFEQQAHSFEEALAEEQAQTEAYRTEAAELSQALADAHAELGTARDGRAEADSSALTEQNEALAAEVSALGEQLQAKGAQVSELSAQVSELHSLSGSPAPTSSPTSPRVQVRVRGVEDEREAAGLSRFAPVQLRAFSARGGAADDTQQQILALRQQLRETRERASVSVQQHNSSKERKESISRLAARARRARLGSSTDEKVSTLLALTDE